jgi:hypothetical protein
MMRPVSAGNFHRFKIRQGKSVGDDARSRPELGAQFFLKPDIGCLEQKKKNHISPAEIAIKNIFLHHLNPRPDSGEMNPQSSQKQQQWINFYAKAAATEFLGRQSQNPAVARTSVNNQLPGFYGRGPEQGSDAATRGRQPRRAKTHGISQRNRAQKNQNSANQQQYLWINTTHKSNIIIKIKTFTNL